MLSPPSVGASWVCCLFWSFSRLSVFFFGAIRITIHLRLLSLHRAIWPILTYVSLEAQLLKASPADTGKVRVSACTQKNPNLRCGFLKRRLTNSLRRHRLADGQLSSLYAPSPIFSSFGVASVILCCSAPPTSSSAPLRPSVPYPSIGLVVYIM